MSLDFPNISRFFDETHNRVCFWGYDRTIEVSFFVGADTLKMLCPDMESAEAGFLLAFDATVDRIHEVAGKIYSRGAKGKGTYAFNLTENDF